MAQPTQITSVSHLNSLLSSSKVVVADFYADWCGPCKTIAPLYAQLSIQLSRPNKITFVKVNTEKVQEVARAYNVTSLPTFIIFKEQREVERIKGASPPQLQAAVKKLAAEADGSEGFGPVGGSGSWTGGAGPSGYKDVTEQVDVRGLDMLNSSSDFGTARTLFDSAMPSSLGTGKGKGKASQEAPEKDWVESDTDEQLMLFTPFQSTLKVHTLQLTSLPPKSTGDDDDDDEIPMRPKTIHLYSNRANVLGFDEAEGLPATQSFTIEEKDWDEKTGTVTLSLRYVKFQSVHSLVIFVVDGDGDGEKIRLDRIRVFGETGEKRDQGKLEKVGEHE